jgi:hypothetical protein
MSPRDAATTLGIRLDHLYLLLWSKKIAAEKRDGRWIVSAEDIERRLAKRTPKKGTQKVSRP